METELIQGALAGGADAATIVIALALLDLRSRMSKVEEKILYILTELAKRGNPLTHQFVERQ